MVREGVSIAGEKIISATHGGVGRQTSSSKKQARSAYLGVPSLTERAYHRATTFDGRRVYLKYTTDLRSASFDTILFFWRSVSCKQGFGYY